MSSIGGFDGNKRYRPDEEIDSSSEIQGKTKQGKTSPSTPKVKAKVDEKVAEVVKNKKRDRPDNPQETNEPIKCTGEDENPKVQKLAKKLIAVQYEADVADRVGEAERADFVANLDAVLAEMPLEETKEHFLELLNSLASGVAEKIVTQIRQCPFLTAKHFICRAIPYLKDIKDDALVALMVESMTSHEHDEEEIKYMLSQLACIPVARRFIDATGYKGSFEKLVDIVFRVPADELEHTLSQAVPILREVPAEDFKDVLNRFLYCPEDKKMHFSDALKAAQELCLRYSELGLSNVLQVLNEHSFEHRESVVDAIARAAPFCDKIWLGSLVSLIVQIPVEQRNAPEMRWVQLLAGTRNGEMSARLLSAILAVPQEQRNGVCDRVEALRQSLSDDIKYLVFDLIDQVPGEKLVHFVEQVCRFFEGADKDDRYWIISSTTRGTPEERIALINDALLFMAPGVSRLSIFEFLMNNTAEQRNAIKELTGSFFSGIQLSAEQRIEIFTTLAQVGASKSFVFSSVDQDATEQRRAVVAYAEKLTSAQDSYGIKLKILKVLGSIDRDQRDDILLQAEPWLLGSSSVAAADIIETIGFLPTERRAAILAAASKWQPMNGIDKAALIAGFKWIDLNEDMEKLRMQTAPFVADLHDSTLIFTMAMAVSRIPAENRAAVLPCALRVLNGCLGAERAAFLPSFSDIPLDQLEAIESSAELFSEGVAPAVRAVIFIAIARIASEERDAVLTNLRPWILGVRSPEVANVISLFDSMSQELRLRVIARATALAQSVASAQQRLNLLRMVCQEMLRPVEVDSSYTMDLAREDLHNQPMNVLRNLVEKFQNEQAYTLKIYFLDEPGIDAGGVGREFISELFEGIKKSLQFKQCDNGLYRPTLPMKNFEYQPLSEEEKKQYQQLGALMKFCLNATVEYPIGMLFDHAVFTFLTKVQAKHLDKPFEELDFAELFAIYEAMNSENEADMKTLEMMKGYLAVEETKEQTRETIESIMRPVMVPLIEIAKGMKAAPFLRFTWEDLQQIAPGALSEKLQGKVTRDMIIDKLAFGDSIAPNMREWIQAWIKEADFDKVQRFLFAMTGARALGNKGLKIDASNENVHFHTCTNSVEMPLHTIQSQQELYEFMELALAGTERFSRG